MLRKSLLVGLVMALGVVSIVSGETIEITGGNSQGIGTAGVEAVISDIYTGEGTLVIQAGTMKYTSASPTVPKVVTYVTNNVEKTADVNSLVNVANITIQNGAALVFDDKITPLSVGTSEFQIEAGGTLRFLNTAGSVSHNADNSFSNYGGKTTISGAGTFEKTGAGALALLNNGTAAGTVTVKMDAGGWIDVQAGTFISGGWSDKISWTANKGSLNLAAGTTLNLWDGNSPAYVDNLTGSGTITRGAVVLGVAGNVNNAAFGVANNTAEFSGVIENGTKVGAVTKNGAGTQILSGNNTYTGTTTISGGTLQIGNGGTTGTLGTGAVSVAAGATLALHRADGGTITNALTNNGTIDILSGTFILSGLTDSTTGAYHVASAGGLTIASKTMLEHTMADAGALLMLGVDPTGVNGWTTAEIGALRASGDTTYGAYNAGAVVAADALLTGSQRLIVAGAGGFQLTAANSDFTQGITVKQGDFALTGAASLNTACPILLEANTTFTYDYGAGTETAITNTISGDGALIIKSGTAKYTTASPITSQTFKSSANADVTISDSRVLVKQTTIKDGAVLLFEDKVMPHSVGVSNYTIEAGGTLRLDNSATRVNHDAENTFVYDGVKTTIDGAGTLEKTGDGAIALLNNTSGVSSTTIKMDAGGWIDVQGGTLISGGWSTGVSWMNNKSSLNLAAGTTMNMWDGNTPAYVDNLTGSGTFTKGQIVLGVAGNVNSEKFGVANNTAEFSGIINNGDKVGAVTKKGTGTQILSGNNTYTGATTVLEGTLQIGNGGTSGTIGTGAVSVAGSATLAYNRSDAVTGPAVSGNGTVVNLGTGALSLNMADSPAVSLRTAAGAAIHYSVTDGALSGTYSGAGTIHFAGANANLNASSALFTSTGRTVFDGGTLTAPAYSQFGTLVANEDLTWNLAGSDSTWKVTMYTDASLAGKILPWSNYTTAEDLGTATDMDAYVNNTNAAEYAVISKHQSAVSYTATVYLPEALTLEACGGYDDWAGIFYKKLVNADGTAPDSLVWEALLPYSDAKCGAVTISGDAAPTLTAGYYQFDVRVADDAGSAYANKADLVDVNTAKRLGLGIRLKDSGLADGSYYDLSIKEDGTVGLPDGKILMFNPAAKVATNMEIADGKILTLSNGTTPITSLDIQSTVTGPGTLVLENTQDKSVPYSFRGSVEGNMNVGNDIALSVYDSTVGGDFTLAAGSTYQMKKLDGENNYVGRLNVTGGFNADGATFEIDLTDVPTLEMDPNFAFVTADSASIEGAKFHITYSGPAVDDNVVYNLIATPEGTAPDWSMADFEFSIQSAGDVVMMAAFADGQYQVVVGNSNSLPEPATWLLLACAFAGLGVWKWRKK